MPAVQWPCSATRSTHKTLACSATGFMLSRRMLEVLQIKSKMCFPLRTFGRRAFGPSNLHWKTYLFPCFPAKGRAEVSDQDSSVSVRNLERRFGDFVAVDNVSFDVGSGEVFGFLG